MATVKRPTGVTVLAILNLLFGAYGLFGLVMAIVAFSTALNLQPAPIPDKPADPLDIFGVMKEQTQFIMTECPNYKTMNMFAVAVGAINALLLIVSGIGLLKMRPWARTLCYAYVALGLIATVVNTSYGMVATVPATTKYEQERNARLQKLGKPVPPATGGIGATIGVGVGAFCGILYPLVVLGLMLAPSTRAAFSGRAPMADDERRRDADELDEDRPLRRRALEDDRPPPRDDDDRFRARPGE
ncbi:MAG: hypothetical protein ACJ8F7_14590 [Gemmataceae bacterium]